MLQIYYIYNFKSHKNTFMSCFLTSVRTPLTVPWCEDISQMMLDLDFRDEFKKWKNITYYMVCQACEIKYFPPHKSCTLIQFMII